MCWAYRDQACKYRGLDHPEYREKTRSKCHLRCVRSPKRIRIMETPLDLVSDSYSVEISDIQDHKPLSAVGTMLRPLFLSLFAEWDCGKGMKAWRTTDTTGTLYCLNMRIKKYSTTWTEKGRACRVCASKGRLCVNIVRPGGLTVLSLPDEKRQGTADDLTYWVVNS